VNTYRRNADTELSHNFEHLLQSNYIVQGSKIVNSGFPRHITVKQLLSPPSPYKCIYTPFTHTPSMCHKAQPVHLFFNKDLFFFFLRTHNTTDGTPNTRNPISSQKPSRAFSFLPHLFKHSSKLNEDLVKKSIYKLTTSSNTKANNPTLTQVQKSLLSVRRVESKENLPN
jgi:hypothetical protein